MLKERDKDELLMGIQWILPKCMTCEYREENKCLFYRTEIENVPTDTFKCENYKEKQGEI